MNDKDETKNEAATGGVRLERVVRPLPRMTPEDQECFCESVLNPPPVAEPLRRALARRRDLLTAVTHGVDCVKAAHAGSGYLHGEGDDTPYDVDGLMYCGRCHTWLAT